MCPRPGWLYSPKYEALNQAISSAIDEISEKGGYLEHRRKTPIGIQVLWRGWDKLQDLVEGWRLANQT